MNLGRLLLSIASVLLCVSSAEAEEPPSLKTSLVPQFHFANNYAKDSAGETSSFATKSLVPSLELTLQKYFSPEWQGVGELGVAYSEWQTDSKQDTLASSKQWQGYANLGVDRVFGEKRLLGVAIGLSQQIFIQRVSADSLKLVSLAVPEISLEGQTPLGLVVSSEMGLQGRVSYLMSASRDGIKARSGVGGRLALTGTIRNSWRPMTAAIYFDQRSQKTNIEDWKSTELGFTLTFDFDSGGQQL